MSAGEARPLPELLAEHRFDLVELARQHAGRALLRMESAEDLAHGACAQALASTSAFDWRGETAFRGWLSELARNHVQARRRHWHTLKRGSGQLLRIAAEDESLAPLRDVAASVTGPSTFATRREQLELAAKALSLLPERDRAWITALVEGVSIAEEAQQRGLSYDAASQARLRALQRFRKVFELARTGWRSS